MTACLLRALIRGPFALLFISLLLSQAFAESLPGPAMGPVSVDVTNVSAAKDQQPATNSQQQPQTKQEEPRHPDLLDGTLSAEGDLEQDYEDDNSSTSLFHLPTLLTNWFAWKESIKEKYGISFGASWGVLWQNYTNSLISQPNAVGSKVAINLGYDLFNRGKSNAFSIDMAIEDRRPFWTNLPPLQAGIGGGSIVPTAATWGQFNWGVTQLYIRQSLAENHFQYTIGKLFAPNYVDAYPFFDDNRQFLSQQFSTSPTMASALRGFGAVAAWFPTDGGLYLKGGMFTSLSSDTGSTINDFFTKNEHFYSFEAGLSGLARTGTAIHARGPTDANNIHVTSWSRNATNSSPRSYGFVFNANYMLGTQVMWFLRGGWSKDFLANGALSGGLGWRPPKSKTDLFGAGFGWTHPSSGLLRSQYTAETFYRFHLAPNIAVTPDIQLVLHPTLNPTVNTMWVFSLRGRMSF
jgi:porin